MINEQQKIQHLFWRAGFGPSYAILEKDNRHSLKNETEKLFDDSKEFIPLKAALENYPSKRETKRMNTEDKKKVRRMENQLLIDLNSNWVMRMAEDKQVLREKMTFFWSGHFACRINDIRFAGMMNNTIRKHALGNFGELLTAVSKEPGMLLFLNSRQNVKQHPNENFSREVMELFTLGRGNYSEEDVKEAARAFTGWNFNGEGLFFFNERFHDFGSKTFLGHTGNFKGEDVLKIILEKKQCAHFIAAKVYKFFVNDEPDEKIISSLGDSFYASGYDIEKLMREVFTSDWFFNEKNMGVKIKSPVELLAGMIKNFGLKFNNAKSIIFYERVLGQVLFQPPNVSGWPGGKNWIDNSTLMVRLMLAKRLLKGTIVDMLPKEEYDVQLIEMNKMDKRTYNENLRLLPFVDWTGLLDAVSKIKDDKVNEALISLFIQSDPKKINRDLLNQYADSSSQAERIKNMTVDILSLPEYQLC